MSSSEHPISQRIKIIIDKESNGKVVDFASKLSGIPYQVISRLYKMDPRSGKFPTPSTDLLLEIINKFILYNPEWIMTGNGGMLKNEEKKNYVLNEERVPYTTGAALLTNDLEDQWKNEFIELSRKYNKLLEDHTLLLQNRLKEALDNLNKRDNSSSSEDEGSVA